MTGPPDLLVALDAIDLQLAAGGDEVVLPRDAAELVARALHFLLVERELVGHALHDLLGQPREGGVR